MNDAPNRCPRERLDEAVRTLLSADSFDAAAAQLGTSPRSLRRWRSDPVFVARLAAARAAVAAQAADRLAAAAVEAANVLRANLSSMRPDVRHRAAVAILKLAFSPDVRETRRLGRHDEERWDREESSAWMTDT